jgi:hypothetical protein
VKKGMNYFFGTGEDSEGSDDDDLILIAIAFLVFVIFLAASFLVARRFFPSVREKIEVVLRMIFYNKLISAFLKAYLRLSLISCEKSFVALAGNMFYYQHIIISIYQYTITSHNRVFAKTDF